MFKLLCVMMYVHKPFTIKILVKYVENTVRWDPKGYMAGSDKISIQKGITQKTPKSVDGI